MRRLPFWDHAEELRTTLLRCGWTILITTLLAFCFHSHILSILLAPLPLGEKLYLLNPLEGFATAAKISLWMGIMFSAPLWLYFLLSFLLPAFKPREKALLLPFLFLSFVFTCGGIIFAYTITIPLVMRFFYAFNNGLGENLWSLGQTLDLIIGVIVAHGLVFECYVVLLFLIRFGVLSYQLLKKIRKGVIVLIFILAAILTPPDVLSQLLLAFPMLILFESSLFYARLKQKRSGIL